jgi:predicted GNAT superfamily acetyltransferase
MLQLRRPTPADHAAVASVVNEWWGGRDLQALVQALFFEHFASTSLIETDADGVCSFLLAFDSADHADVTYIHFVGVRPDRRGEHRGRLLYERTFADARARGRERVRCITGLSNRGSIAFHLAMGFSIEAGDATDEDGVAYHRDHGGPGVDQVLFTRRL